MSTYETGSPTWRPTSLPQLAGKRKKGSHRVEPTTILPRTSLDRILADLGTTLLDLAAGDPHAAGAISSVTIYDRYDDTLTPPGSIVLGVGVHDPAETAAVLDELGRAAAAALIVRGPAIVDDAVRAAVGRSRVVLLVLARGASWTHLAALLRSMLAEGQVDGAGPEALGGVPAGDLFALANALSALVDAPLTIEDTSSRVLAFSGHQESGDQSRIETILGRQVPPRYTALLEERGVFREVYRSDRPVFVDPARLGVPAIAQPRVAVAVRAGDEVLGSLWAIVRAPLPTETEQVLIDCAKLAAVHILHQRAGDDVEYRLRADLVSTVLEGGAGAGSAASRLGIGRRLNVAVALDVRGAAPAAAPAANREDLRRLAGAFALHLSAVHCGSATALLGNVVYGILPAAAGGADPEEAAVRIVSEFLDRLGDRHDIVAGVGRPATELGELPRSRKDADAVLRVLHTRANSRRVAQLADVYVHILLQALSDFVEAERYDEVGPLTRLESYDTSHHTQLVPTLTAWLDAFGDIAAAAAAVHVHPNTLRYRLRRLADLAVLDLDNPDDRFAAMLQLRVASRT